jgi:hypothetical protein
MFASELISSNNQIHFSDEPDKAAFEFAASIVYRQGKLKF